MKQDRHARRTLAAMVLVFLPLAGISAPVEPAPGVDPTVPHPDSTPCVVQLADNAPFISYEAGDPESPIPYAPPADCPRPWAKVVLKMDVTGSRKASSRAMRLMLGNVVLYQAPAPRSEQPVTWHVERDLTDVSAALARPGFGSLLRDYVYDPWVSPLTPPTASATLLFYPPTPGAPAPQVPDVVVGFSSSDASISWPHNIERAYVDVYNAPGYTDYTCVTDAAWQAYPALHSQIAPGDEPDVGTWLPDQGCKGGSFRELRLELDRMPVGTAPWFPMVLGDQHTYLHNFLNEPAPAPQFANLLPYRVDLTPFAGYLSSGQADQLLIRTPRYDRPVYANLLLYLDHGQAQVTGEVTLNTLATGSATPVVTDTLASADDTLQGQLVTQLERSYEIDGYVDTSHGRVHTVVTQDDSFDNTQTFDVDGLTFPYYRAYQQDVQLRTGAVRVSRRTGPDGKLIAEEREQVAYPLDLHYFMRARDELVDGDGYVWPVEADVSLRQSREVARTHQREGMGRPDATYLDETFQAHRSRAIEPSVVDTLWTSARDYSYLDTRGSCYQASLQTDDGSVTSTGSAAGCPGGSNDVRWFAHPDGSPDALDWMP